MEKYVASDTSELLLLSRSNSDEYLQVLAMLNLNQEIADQDITFIMLSHIAEIEAISVNYLLLAGITTFFPYYMTLT